MVKQGWVALHRQIQDHWIWEDKPFSRGQAWTDLLLLANHSDKRFLLGNDLVEVKQGSFITSELKLSERWGWSKTKVRAFLSLLQDDEMIIKKSDNKKTTLTIVNYSEYAVFETAEKPQKDRKKTAEKPQKNTNNNENNDNNENNNKKESKKERKTTTYDEILSSVIDDSLRELYLEYIKMRKMIKSPMTDRALTMLIKKVNQLEPTDISRQKQLLETAIMNNWKSVYPIKDNVTPKAEENQSSYKRNYSLELFEQMLNSDNGKLPKTVATDQEVKARAEKLKKQLAATK